MLDVEQRESNQNRLVLIAAPCEALGRVSVCLKCVSDYLCHGPYCGCAAKTLAGGQRCRLAVSRVCILLSITSANP